MTDAKIVNRAPAPPQPETPEAGAWRAVATILKNQQAEIAWLKQQLALLTAKLNGDDT